MSPRRTPGNGSSNPPRVEFSSDGRSADELQNDIRQTRSRLDHEIDALADRFHPKAILHDLADAFRGEGSGMSRKLIDNIKRNPVPAAMVGAGLAWLLMSDEQTTGPGRRLMQRFGGSDAAADTYPRSRHGMEASVGTGGAGGAGGFNTSEGGGYSESMHEIADEYAGGDIPPLELDELESIDVVYPEYRAYHEIETESTRYEAADESQEARGVRERLEAARIRARDAAPAAAEKARQGGGSMMEMVRKAAARVADATHSATDKARHAASATASGLGSGRHAAGESLTAAGHSIASAGASARHGIASGSRHAASSLTHGYRRSAEALHDSAERAPLTTGLACMAAGLVAGLLIPSTRAEDEYLGHAADAMKEKAASAATDAAERAKKAASASASAAMERAEEDGLTPSNLADKVKAVAQSVAEAGRQTAEEEGLTPAALKEKAADVGRHTGEVAREEFSRQAEQSQARQELEKLDEKTT